MLDPKMSLEEIKAAGTFFSNEEFYRYLIDRLRLRGFEVREFTEYQFRINGFLDVYPVNRRWHDIKKNQRGGYADIFAFVDKYIGQYNAAVEKPSIKVHYDQ